MYVNKETNYIVDFNIKGHQKTCLYLKLTYFNKETNYDVYINIKCVSLFLFIFKEEILEQRLAANIESFRKKLKEIFFPIVS
jgi:hypothetical protein